MKRPSLTVLIKRLATAKKANLAAAVKANAATAAAQKTSEQLDEAQSALRSEIERQTTPDPIRAR